jgi:hypothetical protein
MQSRWEKPSEASSSNSHWFKLPSDLLLSVTTSPFILLLMGSKVVSDTILEMSRSSEAVFQGDRLPVLNFPHQTRQQ